MFTFSKKIIMAMLLTIGTFSMVGCSGGEADYSFDEVQINQFLFLSNERITTQDTDVEIVTIEVRSSTAVQYTIIGGNDSQYFDINSTTGVLCFKDGIVPSDWNEPDRYYTVLIEATDENGKKISKTFIVQVVEDISVIPPEISSLATVTMSGDEVYVLNIEAYTPSQTQLHYALSGGTHVSLFSIDANGRLVFNATPDVTYPDQITEDKVFFVEVMVTDTNEQPLSTTQLITVNVLGDKTLIPPVLQTQGPFYPKEGSYDVASLEGDSVREGATIGYVLKDTFDATYFTLDESTGLLRFTTALDYENTVKQTFNIEVYLEDDLGNVSDIVGYTIYLQNIVNENPYFTPDNYTLDVNVQEGVQFVADLEAASPLEIAVLSYSIDTGYADGDLFVIDTSTGVVEFINPPSYDSGSLFFSGDNNYDIRVYVTDQFDNDEYKYIDIDVIR